MCELANDDTCRYLWHFCDETRKGPYLQMHLLFTLGQKNSQMCCRFQEIKISHHLRYSCNIKKKTTSYINQLHISCLNHIFDVTNPEGILTCFLIVFLLLFCLYLRLICIPKMKHSTEWMKLDFRLPDSYQNLFGHDQTMKRKSDIVTVVAGGSM